MSNAAAPVQYARNGDVELAYRVVGGGEIDLVLVLGFLTHLNLYWEEPHFRRFCERLASFARVILFDKRGMGLSDRVEIGTLEERMDDVRAVLDAVGSDCAVLMGTSEGGPMSVLFAATYPERTQALVLCGAEVKEETTPDWPWGEATREQFEAFLPTVASSWGRNSITDRILPSRAADPSLHDWGVRCQVEAATPRVAAAFMRMAFEIDVRHVLPAVHVPTLVLHARRDQVSHVENGRYLARHIQGARYVELDGVDHVPWGMDAEVAVAEIGEFLTGTRPLREPERVLATVLFTDIVDSTRLAEELGDHRWRQLLERHHALVREQLARHRGRELDTAGDGFLASFDGPARAVRCAEAIVDDVDALGISVRAGIHTGECERMGEKLAGIAVHVGARIADAAQPGEVLVSGTVYDLVAGSGLAFADRGLATLKGLPGERRLYAVASSTPT